MPTYLYVCENPDHKACTFEIEKSMSEAHLQELCPQCNKAKYIRRDYAGEQITGTMHAQTVGMRAAINADKRKK